ncbi:phosphatidylinositide phosphatase SAC2 [Lepeophtheirus salmonis]|nr:phosphatidylinositide phosphatase SAC2-like [Lepeophtheirus salmonis]
MEFIQTQDHFVFQYLQKGSSVNLWIHRKTGTVSLKDSWELTSEENPECLGLVYGIVGKIRFHSELPERLILIREVSRCGELPIHAHPVYKIRSVLAVPIVSSSPVGPLQLKICPKHSSQTNSWENSEKPHEVPLPTSRLKKFGAPLKLLASDSIKSAGSAASALASQVVKLNNGSVNSGGGANNAYVSPAANKTLERYEKRMLEEFYKLFNDSDSFFYSPSGDLSNSLQRQQEKDPQTQSLPLWKQFDDRFFFNKHMLSSLIELNDSRMDPWIVPIIQGYVEFVKCPQEYSEPELQNLPSYYEIILISRRSRHRAGTRYKRRGVDEDGNVANFVETEQILLYHRYALSFVIVRGSVPVYWSQPGYRYRPPPVLDHSKEENFQAFKKHYDDTFTKYGSPIVTINLAEKLGREKVITDAFFDNAIAYNNEHLLFVCFDFHEYCRGMHFENVDVLVRSIELSIRSMRYCWFDSEGMVCGQLGVFRINCIDCLDRTNVVQTAIARAVLEIQLTKLGLVPPEQNLEEATKLSFQALWANNGDVISRQYAGTNALKGDFTRTGERNLSGMMKDGMNSASRYYLNQFRDTLRQQIIDLVTGVATDDYNEITNIGEDIDNPKMQESSSIIGKEDEEQQVKNIIEDCKKLLIPNLDDVIGAWGLIDNDPASTDPRQEDMDTILILVRDSYYVAFYDDNSEKITEFQNILLKDVEKIEFGIPEKDTFNLPSFRTKRRDEHCIRVHYKMRNESGEEDLGYFHSFRSTNLRFFNNVPVTVTSEDERIESLKSIVDTLSVTIELGTNSTPVVIYGKLDKRRSKVPLDLKSSNTSSSVSLRAVGNKALSKFAAKLNPMKLRNSRPDEDNNSGEDDSVRGNENDPSIFSDFLSPLDAGVRQLSRSSDNIQRFFEGVGEGDHKRTSSHKNLHINQKNEETVLETSSLGFSPFDKITKGLQNIGASIGRSDKRPEEGGGIVANQEESLKEAETLKAFSDESIDYMNYRLKEVDTKTQFILL